VAGAAAKGSAENPGEGRPAGKSRPFDNMPADRLESSVRERCLRLLAQQPRTRAELERNLARAGAPEDVVSRVLERFSGVGLVDDTAYAEAYMRTGVGVRRRGTRSLRAELRGRGVAPEIIESASEEIDEETERATALALARRRAAALSRLAPEVRRRRLTGLLLRRGFSGGIVSSVLSEVLQGPAVGGGDGLDDGIGLGLADEVVAESFERASSTFDD
jgi:regulatory protein